MRNWKEIGKTKLQNIRTRSSMNFLIDGDALLIFCSASLVRERVSTEAGLPCSWVVQMSWPGLS